MRAIARQEYGSAEGLELREVPAPTAGPGEVLVRVHASSIGADVWHVMTGLPLLARPAFGIPRPKQPIIGGDLAGTVESVGPDVTGFSPGDRVLGRGDGTFADLAVAKAAHLALLPEGVDWTTAAALPVSGGTANDVFSAAPVRAGQRVLVIGAAGGVGHLAVQLAVRAGGEVTGVCRPAAVDFVRGLGAERTVGYDLADTTGYDLIVDTGGRRPLREVRRHLASDGTVVIVGGDGGGRLLGGFERSIFAPLAGIGSRQRFVGLISRESGATTAATAALASAGELRPGIHTKLPLERAADGIRMFVGGGVLGKIVLEH